MPPSLSPTHRCRRRDSERIAERRRIDGDAVQRQSIVSVTSSAWSRLTDWTNVRHLLTSPVVIDRQRRIIVDLWSTHVTYFTKSRIICTSRQRHQEVWSGTITTDASGVTLAGHSRASKLQAGSADPPVSARQGASVPIKLLHSSQSSSFAAASTHRCTSSTDRTSTSSQHLRSEGICCRWSDDV